MVRAVSDKLSSVSGVKINWKLDSHTFLDI